VRDTVATGNIETLNGMATKGKQKIINDLQPLQHFIMLRRLLFTYTLNTTKQKKEEYKEVISFLKRGYSVRNTAKFCFTNPLPLGKVNTFPLHSLNRGFPMLALVQFKG